MNNEEDIIQKIDKVEYDNNLSQEQKNLIQKHIENMTIIQGLIVLFLIALQGFLYMFILRIIINNTIQLVNSRIKEKARMTKLIFAIPICEIVIGLILCVPIYNALYELI